MGGAISAPQFTSLEAELRKPTDASDVKNDHGDLIREVQRIRKMIYIESTQRNQSSTSSLTNLINNAVVTPETHAQDHDDYQERKLRRRASGSILGKLSKKASIPAKELLNIVKNTHKHSDHIAASIATGSAGTTTTDMATDAHAHVQNMILHDYHDREVAVMVSDLRGFTSTTRKYGIVHFASIIVRMRQLVYPIFDKYKALNINTEADNFITVFPDAVSAVGAALEMQQILLKYNASLSEERQHFKVRLNGIGIGCGLGILLDKEGKLHGVPANDAYHLGEDVCENGMVLMTALCAERVLLDPRLSAEGATVVKDFPYTDEESEETIMYKQISVGDTLVLEAELVTTEDNTFLPSQLSLFASRHNPSTDLAKVDSIIAEKFKKNFTAMMFHLDLETGAKTWGASQLIALKTISLSLLRPIMHKYHAIELEPELFVFHETSDAVLAVLEAKAVVLHYNTGLSEADEKDKLDVIGWGVHHGTMIFVEGTDIHWGDPVNTASKLGQDLATNGDLLISEVVYQLSQEHHMLEKEKGIVFEKRMLKRSGVDFPAYCVTRLVVKGGEGEAGK